MDLLMAQLFAIANESRLCSAIYIKFQPQRFYILLLFNSFFGVEVIIFSYKIRSKGFDLYVFLFESSTFLAAVSRILRSGLFSFFLNFLWPLRVRWFLKNINYVFIMERNENARFWERGRR